MISKLLMMNNKGSKNVKIELWLHPYFVFIDGERIWMPEVPEMAFWTLVNLCDGRERKVREKEKEGTIKDRSFIAWWTSIDYVDFDIKHEDRNTIRIISKFYDGEDRKEWLCDAETFYKEFITITMKRVDYLKNNPDIFRSSYKNKLLTIEKREEKIIYLQQIIHMFYTI